MSFKYFTFLRPESRFKLEISYNLINFSLFYRCASLVQVHKRFVLSKPTLTVLTVTIPISIVIPPSPIPVAIPRPRSPSIVPAAIVIPLPSIPVRPVPIRPRSPTLLVAIIPSRPSRRRRFPPIAVARVFGALRWRRCRTPARFPIIVPSRGRRPRPFVSPSASFAVPLVGVRSLGKRDVILSRKLLQLLLNLLLNRDGNARKQRREPVQLSQELPAHQPDRDALEHE